MLERRTGEAMKKIGLLVKIAAGLAVLGVVAAVGLSMALRKYLPPEKARELLLTQSRRFLHREVKLRSVDLGLLSGLVAKGVEVSEKPDFKAGRFISADSFQLKIKLLPLLRRNVTVDKLKVSGLKVQVLRRKDGSFNFSDLLTASTAPAAAPARPAAPSAPGAMPFDLKVSEAAVVDGELSIEDEALGAKVRVSRLQAAAWNLGLSSPFEADLSLAVDAQYGGKTYDAKLAWKGRADYAGGNLSKMSASSKKLSLEYAGVTLTAAGQVRNLTAPDMDLRAEVGLKGATMLEIRLADAHLSSLKASPPPDFKGELEVVSKGFSTEGLQFLGVPKVKVPEAMVRYSGSFKGGDLKIDSLIVRVPPYARIDGKGSMLKALSDKPQMQGELNLSLDTPDFKLSDLPPELRPYLQGAPAGLAVPAVKVQGKVSLAGDTASLAQTEIVTKFGKVTVSGSARKPLSPKPEIEASVGVLLNTPEFKASDLPAALPAAVPKDFVVPAAKIEGKAALKGDRLDLEGFKVATRFGEVAVTGSVSKLSSKMPEPDVTLSMRIPETRLADLPIALSTAIPAGISIPPVEASGKVSVADDTARLSGFEVKVSRFGKVTVSGTVSRLSSGKPSADVEAKVAMRVLGLTTSDIPFPVAGLPPKIRIPDMEIDGRVELSGEDAVIDGLTVKARDSSVTLTATAKKLLAGRLEPDFQLSGKVKLPAFKSADIPLPNAPQGLDVPAAELEFDLKGTPDVLRPSFFGATVGKSKVKAVFRTDQNSKLNLLDPAKTDWRQWYFYMKVSTVQISLDSLAGISPATKDLGLKGSFFGQIGRIEGRLGAMSVDKLKGYLVFQKVGAKVYGLDITDFSGEMEADEDSVRVYRFGGPKLEAFEGRVGGERFKLWVSAKDYLTPNPKVELEGEFGYVDLARFLEAKRLYAASKASLQSAGAPGAGPASTATAVSQGKLDLKSTLIVRQLDHQNLNLNDIFLKTELVDITPELTDISGTADVYVGMPVKIPGNESKVDSCATSGGKVNNLIQFLRSEPSLKALAGPVSTLNGIAAVVPGLPGINTLDFQFVDTRFTFKKGVLTVSGTSPAYPKGFVCSNKTGAAIQGTIDLAAKTVDVWVGGGKGGLLGATVHATGPLDNPKTKLTPGGETCPKDHPYCVRQTGR
ncbi:MAG: AsmA family protein [Elusimicrobia bacterium]|nr:AsmA family protein [Elusimicrobiota bacterium]